jgi:hypothetical protein
MVFGTRNPNRNGLSPIEAFRAWPAVGTLTIAAPSKIRKSCDCLGRPLELLKHW